MHWPDHRNKARLLSHTTSHSGSHMPHHCCALCWVPKACMSSLAVTTVRMSSTCRLHPDRRACTQCKCCCTLFGYAYCPSAKACACHLSSISYESFLAATYGSKHIMHQQVKQRYALMCLHHTDAVIWLHKARDWPAKHL